MIKAVTLNINDGPGGPPPDLHERLSQLGPAEIDILCCQGVRRAVDEREDETRIIAQSLRMNCSCFAASHPWQRKKERSTHGVKGLAILTGAGAWMLNSGSLQGVGEADGTKGFVQFALVRKNDTSILVLNLQLCESRKLQLLQLRALFSHPLLKERYGAVVLCGDRQARWSAMELQTITGGSTYALPHHPAPLRPCADEGLLWILVAREQPVAAVTIRNWQTNLSLEFEMNRISPDKVQRPYYLPLSQEEQWVRYKDMSQAFPLETTPGDGKSPPAALCTYSPGVSR